MSSAALSLDIADLVTRSLSGEAVDAAVAGQELADRYPALGMSGDLIGSAIVRAAAMTRQALQTPALQPTSGLSRASAAGSDDRAGDAAPAATRASARSAGTDSGRDDAAGAAQDIALDLNAAIVGSLQLAIAATANAALAIGPGGVRRETDGVSRADHPAGAGERPAPATDHVPRPRDPVATLRRVLFGG